MTWQEHTVIGLCHSITNCSLDSNSMLIPLPADYFLKNLYTIEASPLWYLSYLGFLAILNALSLKTLSEAVLLAKSL